MRNISIIFPLIIIHGWFACNHVSSHSPDGDIQHDVDANAEQDAEGDADDIPDGDNINSRWELVELVGDMWEPRAGFAVVVHAGKLWILGGMVMRNGFPAVTDDVWASSDGVTWELIKPADNSAWHPRANLAAVSMKNRIWVMGGNWDHAGTPEYESDVWASVDGVHWERMMESHWPATNTAWGDRKGLAAVVFDEKIWVMGGADTTSLADVWSSTDGAIWDRADAPWGSRAHHCALVYHDKLWVMGGQKGYTTDAWNDVWFSADGIVWELSGTLPQVVYGHACAVSSNGMWVLGGQGGDAVRNRVWFSADGIAWEPIQYETVFTERWYHGATVFAGSLWVFGGAYQEQMGVSLRNDVWRLPLPAAHE